MSDHEFENYLTLIGRLLRLSSSQREAIGEELRDHFESRLVELVESGLSHHEAVRLALEEFGDAAGLAAQFSKVSQTRKRRLVMRCTVGSVAALAAAIVIAMASWPEQQAGLVMERAGAQTAEKQKEEKPAIPARDEAFAETERKLNGYFQAEFVETPLSDVLSFVREHFKIQFFLDSKVLSDAGIDPSRLPITTSFSRVRGAKFLELVLKQQGMGYLIDNDGFVCITTTDELASRMILRIYDCRNILASASPPNAPSGGENAKPVFGDDTKVDVNKGENHTAISPQVRFHLVQDGGSDGSSSKSAVPWTSADKLINVITGTIATQTWSDEGGPGEIEEYGGLLVISQTQEVHEQIANLLNQLREKLAAPAK
jgi:hypothetical protein